MTPEESIPADQLVSDEVLLAGIDLITDLSVGIGPRPPCSEEEREAAALIDGRLRLLGLEPRIDGFDSARSFGPSYLVVFGLALKAMAMERRFRAVGAICGLASAGLAIGESRFSPRSPLNALKRRRSQNVHATIEPTGDAFRTVCLVSHMDSSRSGLMFHPRVTPHLGNLVTAIGVAVMVQALAPVLRMVRPGRLLLAASRALVAAGFVFVAEREMRGEDVPGANDNASGAAACLCLATQLVGEPLEHTRVVVLVTGSEESGVFGMRDFLQTRDTTGWDFINFDGVSADAPLRVLSDEGGPLSGLKADPDLLAAAEAVGASDPRLRAEPLAQGSGLPYDATPIMAAGGRAISIVNQDGAIPNYHWPTDTVEHVSPAAFGRAVEFGARLVRHLDSTA